MAADYTVYIDEAGDLGLNRGTRWFVLSAVIVKKENEKSIRQVIEKLKSALNCKEIHFSKLRHFEKRAMEPAKDYFTINSPCSKA